MILEDKEPPSQQGLEPADAPPAYDDVAQPQGRTDDKSHGEAELTPTAQAGGSSQTPTTSRGGHVAGNSGKNWFGLGSWFHEKDTRKEVKQTIQALMRDVIKEPSSPASISVVQSCLEACQARGVSFESILSEKFIEGHSPLYWTIVKLSPQSSEPQEINLLDILLSFPLNYTTRSEAYLACLTSCDQNLFQRLRRTPGVQLPSVSAAAEILLGDEPEDELLVENQDGDHGEFRVRWKITHFQKRMRVVGGVGTEIVARGRIWCLAFTVLPRDALLDRATVKAGSWATSVSLLSPSPPTHLDAQFSISEPTSIPAQSSPPSTPLHPSSPPLHPPASPENSSPLVYPPPSRKDPRIRWPNSSKPTTKPPTKPPIALRVKTNAKQLEAPSRRGVVLDLREHVLTSAPQTLIVPLNSHPNGESLQFDGCTYLNLDGSLDVTFEARLARSNGGDCIIC